MKGKLKCFGLLSVLAIMLGLSLSVSSNANALKYEITTIPFGKLYGNQNFYQSGGPELYDSFMFGIPDSALNPDGTSFNFAFDEKNPAHYYNLNYNPQNNECVFDTAGQDANSFNIRHFTTLSSSTTRFYYYNWYFPYYDSSIFDYSDYSGFDVPLTYCNKIGAVSNINSGSFPTLGYQGLVGSYHLKDYIPYRYNYNGIYAQDLNTQDGLHRQAHFMFEELFAPQSEHTPDGILPDRFEGIRIPLGLFRERGIATGTTFEVKGRFAFDSMNPQTDVFTLDSNFGMSVSYKYMTDPLGYGTTGDVSSPCSYELVDNRANESEYPWFLYFSCPVTFQGSWNNTFEEKEKVVGFTFNMGSSNDYMWIYPAKTFALTDFYVITNGNDTPANVPFSDYTIDGSAPQDAPGSALDPSSPTDMDWISSLSNLFSFQLFNPFSGFFLLFTDNSGCVNIPIIAGMLHAESDTYCPWFSADTRNIMTPVIGILATMFVFGFIVRWLKSTNSDFSPESSKGDD